MELWQAWLAAAEEAFAAAQVLESAGHLRSAASRYYYAAYMAATAVLHYRGLTVPPDRKGWSHDMTPDLLREQLQPPGVLRSVRNDLARRLTRLYQTRLQADYIVTILVDAEAVKDARKDSGYILKMLRDVLPER